MRETTNVYFTQMASPSFPEVKAGSQAMIANFLKVTEAGSLLAQSLLPQVPSSGCGLTGSYATSLHLPQRAIATKTFTAWPASKALTLFLTTS